MQLSLCMIVKDEEATLARCLESVQGVVDEIVVVDTGSSDRTPTIAQDHGARVVSFEWCDDFSAARNASLQQAQGDWILVLDADETLARESIKALKQAMQHPETLAMTLLRQEIGAQQAPYSLVSRLFRNHPAIAFSRPYHESIDDSVLEIMQQEPHWRVVDIPGIAIRHTGYHPDAIAQRHKRDRARTAMERYIANHPNDPYICNKLGALYADEGQLDKGLELLQRALAANPAEAPVQYEVHYHLGSIYQQQGDLEQAALHYQAAVEQPIAPQLKLGAYNNWGTVQLERHNPAGAVVLYQKLVNTDPNFPVGYFNLGNALKAMGKLPEAITCYQRATQLDPNYAEAFQNLGAVLLRGGRPSDSMDAFRHAVALYDLQGSPSGHHIRQELASLGFQI